MALVEALRDQVGMLKQQLNTEQAASAELRRIIAALTQRIPELEAPRSSEPPQAPAEATEQPGRVESQPSDRKSTRLNSSHANISYAVFCLKKNIATSPYFSSLTFR